LFSFQVPKDPDRSLKDNIKSFKAKKDAEERQKRTQEAEKKQNLLELRSQNKKSVRAANAMVKMTKSAKKLDVKKEVVVESRIQCDNDDYGYESSAASSMFEKLMKKFEANPEDPMAKFARPKRPLEKNISTKFQPFRRPDSSSSSSSKEPKSSKTVSSSSTSSSSSGSKSSNNASNNAKKNLAPPPSFAELLKLAGNKKKGGPAQAGQADLKKSKDGDIDRPMTQKQREEFMRERNSQLRKEGKLPPSTSSTSSSSTVSILKKSLTEDKPAKSTKVATSSNGSIPSKENNFQQPCQKPKRPPVISGPEFHPAVMSSKKSKPSRPRSPSPEPLRKKAKNAVSNRIESDDEDEYDSEMDDFIDDSDTKMDVSAEIAKMFGYNRHKYRDEDFDDRDMENNRFSDIMKEEARSARIGRMEDLEDIRREEEENRRKKMRKQRNR